MLNLSFHAAHQVLKQKLCFLTIMIFELKCILYLVFLRSGNKDRQAWVSVWWMDIWIALNISAGAAKQLSKQMSSKDHWRPIDYPTTRIPETLLCHKKNWFNANSDINGLFSTRIIHDDLRWEMRLFSSCGQLNWWKQKS